MTPEFSRLVRVDTIGDAAREMVLTADEAERAALAKRFGLIAIASLEGKFSFRREANGIVVIGRVTAAATQPCSITGDPLDAKLDEETRLRFVDESTQGEEIELDDEAIDVLPIEGGAIDLGEAAAETLALALDPFPRGPNAAAALAAAGVIAEDEVVPMNAFAALKDKLKGK